MQKCPNGVQRVELRAKSKPPQDVSVRQECKGAVLVRGLPYQSGRVPAGERMEPSSHVLDNCIPELRTF